MTGSNNKTRDITSNRKYLIKNARGQAAYKARMREAGYKQIAVWVREDVREAGWSVLLRDSGSEKKKTATRSKPARQHE